jgi:hypothetical protein
VWGFENRVLRRIFGPKREKVRGEWRKLHNEELNDMFCSPNIGRANKSRKNEMGAACSSEGGKRRVQGLWGKPDRQRSLAKIGG